MSPFLRHDPAHSRARTGARPQLLLVKVGRLNPSDLSGFVDTQVRCGKRGSTIAGRNDEIPVDLANGLTSSLALVRVPELHLSVFSPGAAFGNSKRRVQARFALGAHDYWLWVTDPVYERRYLAKENDDYELGRVTNAESWRTIRGYVYKLVAAIIEEAP